MMLGSKDQKQRISSSKGGSILAIEGEENLLQAEGVVATGSGKPDDVAANDDEQKVYEEDVDIKSPRA